GSSCPATLIARAINFLTRKHQRKENQQRETCESANTFVSERSGLRPTGALRLRPFSELERLQDLPMGGLPGSPGRRPDPGSGYQTRGGCAARRQRFTA